MIYPNKNNSQALYAGSEKDILLEVDLNGKIRFDVLLFAIYNQSFLKKLIFHFENYTCLRRF